MITLEQRHFADAVARLSSEIDAEGPDSAAAREQLSAVLRAYNTMRPAQYRSVQTVVLEGKPHSIAPALARAHAEVTAQMKQAEHWCNASEDAVAFLWERIERLPGKPYEIWALSALTQK
jgi:hypothetical protein